MVEGGVRPEGPPHCPNGITDFRGLTWYTASESGLQALAGAKGLDSRTAESVRATRRSLAANLVQQQSEVHE